VVHLEKETGLSEEEILNWTLSKFHYRVRLYAWQAHTQKKYQEIMNRPKPGKKK
jgi:hypothetical protein